MNTIDQIFARIQSIIGRGRVTFTDDSGSVQMVQVKINDIETGDQRPRLAEYGFTSFVHPGCDAILVFTGGNRSNGVVIATGDQRYRLHLSEGEVAIHDDLGQKVHLTRSGIVIDGGGLPMTIQNVPKTTMSGDLVVLGQISDQNDIKGTVQHIRDVYDTHTHNDPQGGTVSAPNQLL